LTADLGNVRDLNFDKIVDSLTVSRFTASYILLVIIVYHDFEVYQMDVVVVLLNRDLEK